jgi:NAD+ synthase (glutamine-hydrolysing)
MRAEVGFEFMKIGIAQINTTVGDIQGNLQKMLAAYERLAGDGADLVLYPELVVCGYPPRDLLLKGSFVEECHRALETFVSSVGEAPALVGFVEVNTAEGLPFFNSVAFCKDRQWSTVSRKCLLPTYDVFDEARYFEEGKLTGVVEVSGNTVGVTVCEDLWNQPEVVEQKRYSQNPVQVLADQGVDLVVNLSASPWHMGKGLDRLALLRQAAESCKAPVIYCNLVGGNDELIFDGRSLVVNPKGKVLFEGVGFEEDLVVVDLNGAKTFVEAESEQNGPEVRIDNVRKGLVLGLRDYAWKSGFRKAVLGLSGGIDSAVTAAIAVEALGSENVLGVSLPSGISSQHSREDARELAMNLGIEYHSIGIADIVSAAETALSGLFDGMKMDVTEENIQARARGLLLMAISNKFGALLLTTGNKSELAVGYCTLYGDMCGGLAVISDLPKCLVFDLANHLNRNGEIIPQNTIDKPPSAELRPDQKDEDSLPPYPVLDGILERYVERGESAAQIIHAGYSREVVQDIIRKVDRNEYKRKQAAPGLKITPLAFGTGRRMPIVQKFDAAGVAR